MPIVTKAEDQFRLTAAALREKITEKTKLLVLPYPNNPTGADYEKRRFGGNRPGPAGDQGILVLSDEIYSELTYGGISPM